MLGQLKVKLFVVVSSWALLAFVAWHYESTCGVFFSAACASEYWSAIRWIVLLKWVAPYQTLLGGLAALAAGTFVLLAARATAAEAERTDNANRRRTAVVACSIVSDEFRDAAQPITNFADSAFRKPVVFPQTPSYLHVLHDIDPFLGSVVSAQKRNVEEYILATTYSHEARTRAIASCHIINHLLHLVAERLDSRGNFNLGRGTPLPSGHLDWVLRRIPCDPKSMVGLYALFDWEK